MPNDKEMQDALKADGKKLRSLTGEDHGPVFFLTDEDWDAFCKSLTEPPSPSENLKKLMK